MKNVRIRQSHSDRSRRGVNGRWRCSPRCRDPFARVRREPGAARSADPRTPREREVRDLAAAGLTNREIATRLVLSERTVETHVRNILAELGVTNRAELARDTR
ncbi:response regulator transcription factor [Nocardia sp. MW-W600-9]